MKILSIGNFLNPSWDGSMPDEEHVATALERMGHDVTRLQREEVGPDTIPEESFDFVLVAQWSSYPEGFPDFLAPIPVVYWAFDYQADGQEWHEKLINSAHLYLSKRIADAKYPNWRWLSQDFAPQFLEPATHDGDDTIDILFTGSYIPYATERNEILKAVDERYDLTIHSFTPDLWKAAGFKNVHGPVMDDQLPSLIARAKINLSLDAVVEAGYWSDRNAQIMVCAGYVLFRYVPMAEVVFRYGVEYFHSKEDCLAKIDRALHDPSHRFEVSEAGYNIAMDRLRVSDRVHDLITIVEDVL